jgi:hypothetical protein
MLNLPPLSLIVGTWVGALRCQSITLLQQGLHSLAETIRPFPRDEISGAGRKLASEGRRLVLAGIIRLTGKCLAHELKLRGKRSGINRKKLDLFDSLSRAVLPRYDEQVNWLALKPISGHNSAPCSCRRSDSLR